jgi:hypothetical protein
MSRGRLISIMTRLQARRQGIDSWKSSNSSSSPPHPERLLTHPAFYSVGTEGSFPCVKRSVLEDDYSPVPSAKVHVEVFTKARGTDYSMVLS